MDDLLQAPVEWEVVDVTPVKGPMGKFQIPQTAIDSVNRNGIGLKGPLMTPVGKGHQSLNLALRKYVPSLAHLLMLFVSYCCRLLFNSGVFSAED